ncbi:hypothetical protein QWY77_09365 [Thalassotalea ponticola]|uniref:hypothetical protein n=1 Tax=Thalassotalea ponticola TaxID=1523392 RepID=UPI0025B290CF|nr:hypothetical protein [Thalassotalea ponticola]MDN3652965.1 hypothetical protein [Thalassotalea ponticola]
MKLIMRSEFDNLRLNDQHAFDVDRNGDKQVVKIYAGNKLIAKKVTHKKSIRYFAVKEYKDYLVDLS